MTTTLHVQPADTTPADNFEQAIEHVRSLISDGNARTISILLHNAPWQEFDDGCSVSRANEPQLCLVKKHRYGRVELTLFSQHFDPRTVA